jgi:hypothetical protein
MTPEIYRLLHVVGALLLFLSLGASLAHEAGKAPRWAAMVHGLALLVMVVAGVGVMHKSEPKLEWQPWVFAKIGAWVLLAVMPALVRRGMLPRFVAFVLVVALGGGAAWRGRANPNPF